MASHVHDAKNLYHQWKCNGVIIDSIKCNAFVHYQY